MEIKISFTTVNKRHVCALCAHENCNNEKSLYAATWLYKLSEIYMKLANAPVTKMQ